MKNKGIIKYLLMIILIMFFININVKADRPDNINSTEVKEKEHWTWRSSESESHCTFNSLCPWPKAANVNGNQTYVYCLQQLKHSPIGSNMNNPVEIMSVLNSNVPDYGLIFLMNQTSYGSDNANRDGYKKVQAAIWLYVYYHRGEVVNDPTPQSTGTNVGYIFGTTNTPNVDNVYLNASNGIKISDYTVDNTVTCPQTTEYIYITNLYY